MTRHDYGPRGCCAKKGVQVIGLLGAGAWLVGLGGKIGWRVTTWFLRKRDRLAAEPFSLDDPTPWGSESRR